jgi:NAD(P)-dependent dehydrogenase (short-subunit alcohol dehydrogenase family)
MCSGDPIGFLWGAREAQGSGHIIQVSSIGGVNAFPTVGLYHASKWGLEGFSQSLAAEAAGFGIKVTIVEPGGFATDWGGPSAQRATQMPAYDGARAAIAGFRSTNIPGDPDATGPAILKVVDAKDPPLRMPDDSRPGRSGTTLPSRHRATCRRSGHARHLRVPLAQARRSRDVS